MTTSEATEITNVLAANFRVGYTPTLAAIYRQALTRYTTTDAQTAATHLLENRAEPTFPTWAEFRSLINHEATRHGRHHTTTTTVNPETSPPCPTCGEESHWYLSHAGEWYCSHRCKNHPDHIRADQATRATQPSRFQIPDLSIDRATPSRAVTLLDDEPL